MVGIVINVSLDFDFSAIGNFVIVFYAFHSGVSVAESEVVSGQISSATLLRMKRHLTAIVPNGQFTFAELHKVNPILLHITLRKFLLNEIQRGRLERKQLVPVRNGRPVYRYGKRSGSNESVD